MPAGGGVKRWTIRIGLGLLVAACVLLALAHLLLRASLPRLDGRIGPAALSAPVDIERDALGTPTIRAATRADLAYATGFVHAQDRFFQMDLARRLAAGELAALFGAAALEQDRAARLFRFRTVARAVLAGAAADERAVLGAYARGVNAGLAALASRPWEYWLLGAAPAAWSEEDSVLVAHAMWWDLQYSGFRRERLRRMVEVRLPGPQCGPWKCLAQFFFPPHTHWDSPNPSGAAEDPPALPGIPPPELLSIRDRPGGAPAPLPPEEMPPAAGSNNWAIAGRLSSSGAALVANDMHLGLRVPPVWYRARLQIPAAAGAALDVTGVTLPGTPAIIAGSNGSIAWGFTNSYGNWLDIVPGPCEAPPARDGTPGALVRHTERIEVRGGAADELEVVSGTLGVRFAAEPDGETCWWAQWLATVPEATNFRLLALERARSVREVLALAPGVGIPHQNLLVGDRAGHIAWTILGRIPQRAGTARSSGASGWIAAADHPYILDPPAGRLWSANALPSDARRHQRAIGGDEALLGAEYDLGARAAQIRERLAALPASASPREMLSIQLDDRAVFLERWQRLLLDLLDEHAVSGRPDRAELRRLAAHWNARATADSTGYRLVHAFRRQTERTVWHMVLTALELPAEGLPVPPQFEHALWTLVSERPAHMLAPRYRDWRELLLLQVDEALADLRSSCAALARCTWGERRPVRVRHPLSGAVPVLARLLDMPTLELPGDHHMPRVQDGAFGASERFAVSPGHEAQGYLHLPGGQSAHPLSPFYRAGFDAWAAGEPTPFLPGPAVHRLTLLPRT